MHTHILENRIRPSLSTHLWILSDVLIGRGYTLNDRQLQPELSKWLSRYTAAISYKKMARRFNNTTLSRSYVESLQQVKDIPFMSQPWRERADDRRGRDEVDSDRLFLEDFVRLYTNCPERLNTQIPNLFKMANDVPPNNGVFQLYTNETRTEFHYLLLELLDRFKEALDTLIALDKDEAAKGSDQAVKLFNKNVGNTHRNRYVPLRLSRGHAFRMHLENIKTLLEDPPRQQIQGDIAQDAGASGISSFPFVSVI